MPKQVATKTSAKLTDELFRYMKERGGLIWPDEAARELRVPVIEVLDALRRFEREGKAREVETLPTRA